MIDPFVLQQASENWRAQADVFSEIFLVFLVIGTIVGAVVVIYTLYHVYKYREKDDDTSGFDAPQLGELPTGQGGGKSKKLFVSFGLSAIIVISVVVYSYTLLLYVEAGPTSEIETEGGDSMDIGVSGFQFGWEFEYPNGHTEFDTLRVPASEDQVIRLHVTADDVWHAFGVTELRVKADAIPGQTDTVWFTAEEPGTYTIECFELCGVGHSQMVGEIQVMEEDEFDQWYSETGEEASGSQQVVSS